MSIHNDPVAHPPFQPSLLTCRGKILSTIGLVALAAIATIVGTLASTPGWQWDVALKVFVATITIEGGVIGMMVIIRLAILGYRKWQESRRVNSEAIVLRNGGEVDPKDIERAENGGLTDKEIESDPEEIERQERMDARRESPLTPEQEYFYDYLHIRRPESPARTRTVHTDVSAQNEQVEERVSSQAEVTPNFLDQIPKGETRMIGRNDNVMLGEVPLSGLFGEEDDEGTYKIINYKDEPCVAFIGANPGFVFVKKYESVEAFKARSEFRPTNDEEEAQAVANTHVAGRKKQIDYVNDSPQIKETLHLLARLEKGNILRESNFLDEFENGEIRMIRRNANVMLGDRSLQSLFSEDDKDGAFQIITYNDEPYVAYISRTYPTSVFIHKFESKAAFEARLNFR